MEIRPKINRQSIDGIEIDTYQVALDITDRPEPHTPYQAKFSIQYAVAAGLVDGRAGLEEFSEEHIADHDMRRLLSCTVAREDQAFTAAYPGAWASRVRVRLTNGAVEEATVHHPKGMPANPMNDQEIEQKFHDLVNGVIGTATAGEIVSAVERLSSEASARALISAALSQRDTVSTTGRRA